MWLGKKSCRRGMENSGLEREPGDEWGLWWGVRMERCCGWRLGKEMEATRCPYVPGIMEKT
ncbi:hypothetical protein E2C01_079379 [Portunus trituberculatus]|uniref:Uncharacterized protein n=1 Tax=Portunus trituberculatus TaxID=210409 RepID=A0A5B7IWS2_PORTR|nr:hypothetical protein [Portunus trituberculatus]